MPAATAPFRLLIDEVLPRAAAFVVSEARAPAEVRLRLRLSMASALASAVAADGDERAARITRWARRTAGPHPLVGAKSTTARLESIVGSIARARAGDWDDFALVGRPGAASAMVPLVLAAPADLPWSVVESAQLAAAELGLRAGIASAASARVAHEPTVVAAVSAAAASARVIGLDVDATKCALARALATTGSSYGDAAVAGVVAAEHAYDGLRDVPHIHAHFAHHAFDGLGRTWATSTLQPKEHPAPAAAQTAIDAAREVAAQAHATLRRALRAEDVDHAELETTALGAASDVRASITKCVGRALGVEVPIVVKHAWELTSELLWSAFAAFDPAPLLGHVELRKLLADLDVGAASVAHLAAELSRIVSRRGGDREAALHALALPLASRLTVVLKNGTRLRAERTHARGATIAEARAVVREKLRLAAGARARKIESRVLEPSPNQRVSDVLAALA